MTRTTRHPLRLTPRLARRLIIFIGVVGLLGASVQALARVERDRLALEARVVAVRNAIVQASPDGAAADGEHAQWFNWGNWNNWNNWPNWGNWLNHR